MKMSTTEKLRSSFRQMRMPWKGKRYGVLGAKVDDYFSTPKMPGKYEQKSLSDSELTPNRLRSRRGKNGSGSNFRRNSSLRKSVREVVGSIRQKFKTSTRARTVLADKTNSPWTPNSKRPMKRGAYRNTTTQLYSPFGIETPPRRKTPIRTCVRARREAIETPTRLRKEVEELTSNMRAMATLTPCTLQARSRQRRSTSPMTNGSLKRASARRKIETTVRVH